MAERQPKHPTVSSTEVQRNFREVLRRLNNEGTLIIERDGVPAARLMPLEEGERFTAERDQVIAERLRRLDELGDSLREVVDAQGLTEEKLLEQMKQARHEKNEKRHGIKSRP